MTNPSGPRAPRADPELIAQLFAEAIERPQPERRAFLDSRCPDSPALREELESLLASFERSGGFLEQLDSARSAALLAPAPEPEVVGRRIGPYRLLRELGRGGMGVVYLAERAEGGFEQRVAVKLVKRGMDTEAILKRFARERQILAALEHPNVARLIDGGMSADGRPFFAMEYVDGAPLTDYCDAHGLGVEERLRLFEDACRAVHSAHGKLVVHRDLKPSNMLVTAGGQLKLLDFGVAKLLADDDQATTLTQADSRPLTPDYAAPEQLRGDPVSTSSDVYSLGVVLYELLTGCRPHGGASLEALLRAVSEQEPEPPSVVVARQGSPERLARRLRGDLDTIVLKALHKEPERRYASAEALASDLRRHLDGRPVEARRGTRAYRAAKFVRRHRLGVAAAGAATAALAIGLATTLWQARLAARERDAARREAATAQAVRDFLVGLFSGADPAQAKGENITARELMERGVARIDRDLAGQPLVEADLLGTVAAIDKALGRYDRARASQARALELLRAVHGPDHPDVGRALRALGSILHGAGEYEAAEARLREALALLRRSLPPEHPDVAQVITELGSLLVTRAKLAEAESLLREALALEQKTLAPDDPLTAKTATQLGNLLWAKGEFAGAEELYREALASRRRRLGELHPDVAEALSTLGAALLGRGDAVAAEATHREALAIRRKLFGEEHPSVSLSIHHLAAALHSQGRFRAAEDLYRQGLALDRRLQGPEHPSVAVALVNLGDVLADEGRFDEALALLDQALALHRRVSGADHPRVATALVTKGETLLDQGRVAEARAYLGQALAIRRARFGEAHPAVASVIWLQARVQAAAGDLAGAEQLFRQALTIQRQALPAAHYGPIATRQGLGEALIAQGRTAEAEAILREALELAGRALPARHWRRAEVEVALGACLAASGRPAEARPLLAAGLDTLVATFGADHPKVKRARQLAEVRTKS